MTTPTAPSLYRYYLAADLAEKRLAEVGASADHIVLDRAPLFAGSTGLDHDGTPIAHKWPEVRVVASYTLNTTLSGMMTIDEWDTCRREERQGALDAFIAKFPDTSISYRYNSAYGFFQALDGVGVSIDFGQTTASYVAPEEVAA